MCLERSGPILVFYDGISADRQRKIMEISSVRIAGM
jgi:hypothetical protein